MDKIVKDSPYTVHAPIKYYSSASRASKKSEQAGYLKAGTYYVYKYNEKYNAVNIAERTNLLGVWVNCQENDENLNKSYSTQTSSNIVDPSNTNTMSGYFGSDQTKLSNDGKSGKRSYAAGAKVEFTCYVMNLLTGTKIEFDFPGSGGIGDMSESVSSNYDQVTVRGRTVPIMGFDTSGPRTLSVNIKLHDDFCKEGLAQTIAYFKALCYPKYSSYVEAPVCYVKILKAVKGIFIVGNVNVNYEGPVRDNMYVSADVSFDLTEAGEPMDATEIEQGGGAGWKK